MTIAVISMIRDAWGGSEELWYQMAKAALQQGHKVIHLSYEHPIKHAKMAELEGMNLIRIKRPGWIPASSPSGRLFYLGLNYARKIINDPIKKLLSYQPDVILYNGTCYSITSEKSLLYYLNQPRNQNLPFFIYGQLNNETNRELSEGQSFIIKKAYLRCKNVFFVSNRSIETAERHLCATINNAEVVRNPVNLTSTDIIPFPSPDNIIQLAMVGNLVTVHKGQDIMLHALSRWNQKSWKLNIYGNGPDALYLKNLAKFLNLEDQVSFHGTVNNIRDIWKENHVLLMPSHMEGMPLAIVEAMLCGRICLATNVGGIKEWIQNGENGFIAEAATIDLLVKGLEEVWNRKYDWEQIGKQAHISAMNLYDSQAGKTLLNRIIAE